MSEFRIDSPPEVYGSDAVNLFDALRRSAESYEDNFGAPCGKHTDAPADGGVGEIVNEISYFHEYLFTLFLAASVPVNDSILERSRVTVEL